MNCFRRRERLYLQRRIHSVPAGCYRFLEERDGLIYLLVGRSIFLAFSENARPLLRTTKRIPLTRPEEFVVQHFLHLNEPDGGRCADQSELFSISSVDPSLAVQRELEFETAVYRLGFRYSAADGM